MEVGVRQAPEDLAALSKALKAAEERGLRRELYRGLQRAVKPMQAAARQNAGRLPKRGGYAARVATAKMSAKTRAGRDPSIRVRASSRAGRQVDLYAADSGLIRHMVFGQADNWVWQRVNAGWWTDAVNETAPQARRQIEAALDDVAAQLNRKSRGDF